MTGRGPWMVSGGLLVVAGLLTSASTWRHWAGCRTAPQSTVCQVLEQQSAGLPLWGELGARDVVGTVLTTVAAALLVLAWVVVVGWSRGSIFRRVLAVVVGLQPLLVMVLVGLELWRPGDFFAAATNGWLTWPAEVLVLPFMLGAGWVLEESAGDTLRLIALGWAVTSFGALHHFVDFVVTTQTSGVLADSPPGLGSVTAVTQVGIGIAVIFLSVVLDQASGPGDDDERGPDGYILAA